MANRTGPTALVQKPSLVVFGNARFLITDAPTDSNLPIYIQEFKRNNVTVLVRTCDPSYSDATVRAAGITLYDLPFPDGAWPPDDLLARWLSIVHSTFAAGGDATIAIHCVAGLGRAPVLVAVALIEMGMNRLDTITFIRERRPRAFNLKQINYLENYKRRGKKPCLIM
eukprot:c4819_g1_i1.p1 GENE.c4819_g1_i1~~c4819_g1_i1.p1  ORF type:complete len:169 (-),score=9.58 c4819_g1_i1:107-613(-)